MMNSIAHRKESKLRSLIVTVILFVTFVAFAQQRTTVTATDYDISSNLDLQAVASIFGESQSLEDFEVRLNNPDLRISNLDLNYDGYVDYLRVIEHVENNTHLIIVQAVVGRDRYQDVATIEVERDRRNSNVYVQVVGNSFLYGANYIYEPVYAVTPPLFSLFWSSGYSPYASSWYWDYYPSYYYGYSPYSTRRYRTHVNNYINVNNYYVYHPYRYSNTAQNVYHNHRNDYYEQQYPHNAFRTRYSDLGVTNSYELSRKVSSSDTRSSRTVYADQNSAASNGNGYSRSTYSSASTPSNSSSSSSSNNEGYSRSTYSRSSTPSNSSSSSSSNNEGYSRSAYSSASTPNSSSSSSSGSNQGYSRSSYSRPSTSSSSSSNSSGNSQGYSRSSYSRPSTSSSSSSNSSGSNQGYSRSSYSRPSTSSSSSSNSYSRSSAPSSSSSTGSSRSSYSQQSSASSRSTYKR